MNSKAKLRTIYKRNTGDGTDVVVDFIKIVQIDASITFECTRPLAIRKHAEFITNTIFGAILLAIVLGNQLL